jgi:hypothetical protein
VRPRPRRAVAWTATVVAVLVPAMVASFPLGFSGARFFFPFFFFRFFQFQFVAFALAFFFGFGFLGFDEAEKARPRD